MAGVAGRHDQRHLCLVVTDAGTPSLEERSSPRCGGRGKTSRLKTPVADRDAGTPPLERPSPCYGGRGKMSRSNTPVSGRD